MGGLYIDVGGHLFCQIVPGGSVVGTSKDVLGCREVLFAEVEDSSDYSISMDAMSDQVNARTSPLD